MPIAQTIKIVLKSILTISLTVILLVIGTSCIESESTVSIEEVENSIFKLVNDIRSARGLPILDRRSYLDGLARDYVNNQFSGEAIQSSDIRYLLVNSWEVKYDGNIPCLTPDTAEAQISYCLEQQDMKDVIYRPEARVTGIGIAIIEDTVYYAQVFDVVNSAGGDG